MTIGMSHSRRHFKGMLISLTLWSDLRQSPMIHRPWEADKFSTLNYMRTFSHSRATAAVVSLITTIPSGSSSGY